MKIMHAWRVERAYAKKWREGAAEISVAHKHELEREEEKELTRRSGEKVAQKFPSRTRMNLRGKSRKSLREEVERGWSGNFRRALAWAREGKGERKRELETGRKEKGERESKQRRNMSSSVRAHMR